MLKRAGSAFTLIELLVVIAIIAMILALAAPALGPMMQTSRIMAATDIVRSAVSRTRAKAISSRRGCTLDMARTEAGGRTENLSSSTLLVSDDFDRYEPGVNDLTELNAHWAFYPPLVAGNQSNVWQVVTNQTREIWAGPNSGVVPNAYAWNIHTRTSEAESIDTDVTAEARFMLRRVNPRRRRDEWGFGLLAHYVRDRKKNCGYRFLVRAQSLDSGLNRQSVAVMQKIYNTASPSSENAYDAGTPVPLDPQDKPRVTATVAPGVWYRMKLSVKREKKVVVAAGKVWVDGSPEPIGWTVGPYADVYPGASPPKGMTDAFSYDPFSGNYCGVWAMGGEVGVDDFSVSSREAWMLPGGIHLQPVKDAGKPTEKPLDRYELGSFPLIYRPDGTAAAEDTLWLRITDSSSGNQRYARIDPNTGRVETADWIVE